MLKYSKGQEISLNLTLVDNNGQIEDSAIVNYKIYNGSNTLELSGNNLSFNNQLNGYVDLIEPLVDWLNQEEGIYYIKWEISNTTNLYPQSVTEELYIDDNENKINRILGLVHENCLIKDTVYDKFDNLQSATMLIYSDSDSVGTENNIIGTYEITADTTNVGKFLIWNQKRIS